MANDTSTTVFTVEQLAAFGLTTDDLAKLSAVANAAGKLAMFKADKANAKFIAAMNEIKAREHQRDEYRAKAQALQGEINTLTDTLTKTFGDKYAEYRDLSIAANPGNVTVRVSERKTRSSTRARGTGSGASWVITLDGEKTNWRKAYESLGLPVPDGNFNARDYLVRAANNGEVSKADLARIAISAANGKASELVDDMIAIGITDNRESNS